jgi:hypothetical protein
LKNISDADSLIFPKLYVENDSISIISQTDLVDNNLIIGQNFKICFWETGHIMTPSYKMIVKNKNLENDFTIKPERKIVHVKSVIHQNDTIGVRPLKGPVPVKSLVPYLFLFKIILLSVLIILIILIWIKKRLPVAISASNGEYLDPIEIAKKRLFDLKVGGFSKEFYIEISHITRQYVENSFYIRALEMTTEEIKLNRKIFGFKKDIFNDWLNLLEKADLIKYAKHQVQKSEMEDDKTLALKIIEKF